MTFNYDKYIAGLISSGYHTIIAGQTGSGKSVLLNTFIYTLILIEPPENHRFVLIDPKKVELYRYSRMNTVLYYAEELSGIADALDRCIKIMLKRYDRMKKSGAVKSSEPRIYIIIDELADLMTVNKRLILPKLQRLAQLGRAANITLIAATQAPSRKVIPAELTLNFPQKITLRCDTAIESRQIIGRPGAELLPRYGFGIVKNPEKTEQFKIPITPDELITDLVKKCKQK